MKEKMLIFKDDKIDLKTTFSILVLIMVISGILGFIYETIFYKIDLGYFVKRGSSFGPWIPIYAVGGLLIVLITYRLREKPVLVFIVNCIVTGILEYFTGFMLYEIWGIRLWDYNIEIWNWGNVSGYICFRSILCFGLSSLGMIYLIVPYVKKLARTMKQKKFDIISLGLGGLFLIDVIIYQIVK